jgi:hypothetical protein
MTRVLMPFSADSVNNMHKDVETCDTHLLFNQSKTKIRPTLLLPSLAPWSATLSLLAVFYGNNI